MLLSLSGLSQHFKFLYHLVFRKVIFPLIKIISPLIDRWIFSTSKKGWVLLQMSVCLTWKNKYF